MIRRRVLAALGAAGFFVLAPLRAQTKKARIGFVTSFSPALGSHLDHFRAGLREHGWIEGKNVEIEAHFTDGNMERTRQAIAGLIGRQVDVLLAWTTPVVQIAKQATTSIPIVMMASDPLAAKLVDSLARPGGNITGVSMISPALAGKRLELLREIRPAIRTVAFVGNSKSPGTAAFVKESQGAAGQLGIKLVVRLIDGPAQFDEALLAALKAEGVEALILQPIYTGNRRQMVPLAMKAGLPIVGDYAPFAEAGALFTIGVDDAERLRRTAYYVDRILKGARPSELPVEQASSFQLVINTASAKKLGWTVPRAVLLRADRVIE